MTSPIPIVPDIPGRGSWTTVGGLLPSRPGVKSKVGYYRLADQSRGEVEIGSDFVRKLDESDTAKTVNLAVKALQKLFGMPYYEQDGWLGPKTAEAGIKTQERLNIEADGVFGPKTLRAALTMLLSVKADLYAVPRDILTGLVGFESRFDPAAIGVNGWDHGLCQINLNPKSGNGGKISLEFALSPDLAIDWTAKTLRTVFNQTYTMKRGITTERAWDVAILNHNSPKNSTYLRDNGVYPTEQSESYVLGVRNYS